MTETTALTARFEAARPQLRAVAYRMLGSVDDAEDAVQDAWLRLSGEELVPQVPDPVVDPVGLFDPEHQVILAGAVGLALFVVLDTLAPAGATRPQCGGG